MSAQDHPSKADTVLRVKAIDLVLVEKGIADPAILDVIMNAYDYQIGVPP